MRLALFCNVNSQLVSDWLNSQRSFAVGATLFKQLGGSSAKAALFLKGETTVRREMLIDAMIALQSTLAAQETPAVVAAKAVVAILSDDRYKESPPEVQAMVARVKHLYKEGQAMKSKLLLVATKFERGVLANQIRDCDEVATNLLEEIDFFKVYGYLPSADPLKKTVEEMSAGQLYSRLKYLEPWISRHKKKRPNAADVAAAIHELNLIRKRIDNECI